MWAKMVRYQKRTHVHQGQQFLGDPSDEEFPQEDELGDAVAVDLRPHLQELGQLLQKLRVQGLVGGLHLVQVVLEL